MTENPYQAPQSMPVAVGVLSGTRDDLLSVAKCQKGILVCILIQFVATFGLFALPPEAPLLVRFGVLIVVLVVVLVGAVFVFMLAIKVYGTGFGIILGVLSFVPLIGFFVLFVVNGKATNVLKENGIKVGLLGANVSSMRAEMLTNKSNAWNAAQRFPPEQ
ncbi:MAG: hypothetical protein ABGZ53_32595 [Fuerstiella sp.]